MSAYQLSFQESWALATLLHLPVQPGSALGAWLDSSPAPTAAQLPGANLDSLAARGIYDPRRTDQPLPDNLVRALALLAVNAAELTAVIRTGDKAALTRFAQAGSSLVQFGADETGLTLYDPVPAQALAQTLLPGWFSVQACENLWADLPIGFFLLFKKACALADLDAARSGLVTERLTRMELVDQFRASAGWMDIFNAARLKSTPAVEQLPIEGYFDQMVAQGYLQPVDGQYFEIGGRGKPLSAALSDPGLASLTLSMQTWEDKAVQCGSFLHGGGRLFLLEYAPGKLVIQQMNGVEAGRFWVNNLLSKGSQARYASYVQPQAALAPVMPPPAPIAVTPPPPPPPVVQLSWYYLQNGKQSGPVPEHDLRDWLARGNLAPDTLVWRQSLPGWISAVQAGLVAARAPQVCPRCGAALSPGARFCPACGLKM
jgi:hypothetical protein